MIKIFRKTRQKLLSENKISKYLIYAVGEIILVVIGILIALQVNTWNNKQIAKRQMISNLIGLKEDLKMDTTNFGVAVKNYKRFIERKEIIRKLSFDDIPTDRLRHIASVNISEKRQVLTTYNKITNSTHTQIAENDSLSNEIHAYYTTGLSRFNDLLEWERKSSNEDNIYYNFNLKNQFEIDIKGIPMLQNEKQAREALLIFLSDPRSRNHLKNEYVRKKRMLNFYESSKNIATDLIIDIEKEVKKNQL